VRRTRVRSALAAAAAAGDDRAMTRAAGVLASRPTVAIAIGLLPSLLVLLAAAERPARIPVLVILVAGSLLTRSTPDRRARAAWAAPLPVAVILACALIPEPTTLATASGCVDPAPARVVRRVLEMCVVLLTTLVAGRLTGMPGASLLLRRPSAGIAALSVVGFVAATAGAVLIGPVLAEPFFGPLSLRLPSLVGFVPLVIAAVANAVQEEVGYRGAWLGWGELAIGPGLALGVQALAFGLAHAGSDFIGPALPVVAAMAVGGVVAGLIARATRSLALPIAVHAAADVPMALYWICGPGA
jgi:membrane protease YdiL (CAAX protease family)